MADSTTSFGICLYIPRPEHWPCPQSSYSLIRRILFFFGDFRFQENVDFLLDAGALVIGAIDGARERDERVVEILLRFLLADVVLDLPHRLIDVLQRRLVRRDLGMVLCHRRPDRRQPLELAPHIGAAAFGAQLLRLDFENRDLVNELAPGNRHRWNHESLRTSARKSSAIAANTASQSPGAGWRNRRSDLYHGLSLRSTIQRQSGICFSATQVGRPSAPARCGIAVSEVITRSRFCMIAGVSTKASPPESKSPRVSTAIPAGRWPS